LISFANFFSCRKLSKMPILKIAIIPPSLDKPCNIPTG
jgi:hypothetical protein